MTIFPLNSTICLDQYNLVCFIVTCGEMGEDWLPLVVLPDFFSWERWN